MRFADILKMCFDSLSRRKGRTILTVLGVFIGCTSIIVMVSIGAGMQESYDQMLNNMGDLSIIEVYRGYSENGTSEAKLDDKAVESFHEIAGVKAVMPKASLDGYNVGFKAGVNGRYTADWVNFVGIDSSALEDMGFELVDGRYPENSDEVVVGQYFAYNFTDTLMPDGRNYVSRWVWDENGNIDTENIPDPFFDPLKTSITMVLTPYDDGTGTEPTPYEVELKIVGVMKEDQGKGYETSDGVMMDINALKALIKDLTGKTDTKFEYSSINVKAESLDAVADVVGACLLVHMLAPDEILASPVHVGSGQVRCAHGVLPVPAPATAYLLRGVPLYGGSVRGELCTPTGAALLTQFASEFGPMPLMRVEAVGYGMGKKDFEAANCVRAMLGAAEDAPEAVLELQCNLDDMTAEAVGFAMERLLDAGALDVWTTPIGMKKSRPAVLLSVLCRESDREKVLPVLFRHTTTLGVREQRLRRHTLTRGISVCETPHGPVRVKTVEGFGVHRSKPEYEDLAQIARETGCSLAEAAALLGK